MIGEEIVDAGDKVLVAMHYQARGSLSGVADRRVGVRGAHLRGGQCVSKVEFETRPEALEAVGLSE